MPAPIYTITFSVSGTTPDAAIDHAYALAEAVEQMLDSYVESLELDGITTLRRLRRPRVAIAA